MRKPFAILLLTVMAFNLIGYKAVLTYMQNRANVQMAKQLDKQAYDRATLTEVKVALHLPYSTNDKDFERYNGSIKIGGIIYNYVERKLQNDTLILHCLPNTAANNIVAAGNEYNKAINDLLPIQKGQKNNSSSLLVKVLECTGYRFTGYTALNISLHNLQQTAFKNTSETVADDNFSRSPEQPPDIA